MFIYLNGISNNDKYVLYFFIYCIPLFDTFSLILARALETDWSKAQRQKGKDNVEIIYCLVSDCISCVPISCVSLLVSEPQPVQVEEIEPEIIQADPVQEKTKEKKEKKEKKRKEVEAEIEEEEGI